MQKLHARLGEPVSEEEAKVIVDDITAGQDDDLISFEVSQQHHVDRFLAKPSSYSGLLPLVERLPLHLRRCR